MSELDDREIDARIAELEAAERGGRDFEVLNSQLAANERRVHPSSGPRDYVAPDDEDDEDDRPLHPFRAKAMVITAVVALVALGVTLLGSTISMLAR